MTASPLFPQGWPERLRFLWVTVAVPALAFSVSFDGALAPEWRAPGLKTWADLLMGTPGATGFLPLAVVVMATCLALALKPGPWARTLAARLCFAAGVLLGLQYSVLYAVGYWNPAEHSWTSGPLILVFTALYLACVWGATAGCARFYRGLWLNVSPRRRRQALAAIGIVAWIAIAVASLIDGDVSWGFSVSLIPPAWALIAVVVVSLVAGPAWSVAVLLRTLKRLGPLEPGPAFPRILAVITAVAAYAAAWRVAWTETVLAYQALPESPPDCFVATAASRCPGRLAGGFRRDLPDGRWYRVTPQLQRLKAFELIVLTACPALHRRIRALYDVSGRRLAIRICSPLRAACAWLLLKPIEWTALALILSALGWRGTTLASRLFTPESTDL